MAKIGFEAPTAVDDIVTLLNRSGKWQLTLIDTTGKVHGHYQADYGRSRDGQGGFALIYNGDIDSDSGRPLFTAETDEQAIIFLFGLYLGQFGNRSIESIQDEVTRRPERLI